MSSHWQPLLSSGVETGGPPASALPALSRLQPQGFCGLISYVKRFKMEADLTAIPEAVSTDGFIFVAWDAELLDAHSDVLFRCFEGEIDAEVFASLGDRDGCRCLMTELARKSSFVPGATWLVRCDQGYCGTIQGVRERAGLGAIQNVGILPPYRGRGLGRQLLLRAMRGFREAGLMRTMLEVTAQNDRAVKLYSQLGFRRTKTLYKAVASYLAEDSPHC